MRLYRKKDAETLKLFTFIKLIAVTTIITVILLPASAKNVHSSSMVLYDSFENGVPKHWQLHGKGKLSISDYQSKLGKYSLRWDWQKNDIIEISNSIANIYRRSGGIKKKGRAAFGIWIYNMNLSKQAIEFEFRKNKNRGAKFSLALNFNRWQCAFVQYNAKKNIFDKKLDPKTNNILIKAPQSGKGTLLIDLVVYNGGLDSRINFLPRKNPWRAPKIPTTKYKVKKVTNRDLRALEKIEKYVLPNKKNSNKNNATVDKLIIELKSWNIKMLPKDDTHGSPIQLPSVIGLGKNSYSFFTKNGISRLKLRSYSQNIIFTCKKINRIFAKGITPEQEKKIAKYTIPLLRHLINQGFNTSYGIPMNFVYYKNALSRTVFYLNDYLDSKLQHDLTEFLQYSMNTIFGKDYTNIHMDYFYSYSNLFMLTNITIHENSKRIEAYRFISAKLSREICEQNSMNGFKPDGSIYHHQMHYLGYGYLGLITLSRITYALAESSMSISEDAFRILKKSALCYYFISVSNTLCLVSQGRHPFLNTASRHLPEILKNLALSSRNGIDQELAQAYIDTNPKDNEFSKTYNVKPKLLHGNIAMPYAGIVAQRRNDWLALAYGYGKYFYGVEIYANKNRFGRYTPNGSLDILGKGGFHASGNQENGWDWNRANGTTSIYSSIENLRPSRKGTAPMFTPYGFYGGISWGKKNGCFAMQVHGSAYDSSFEGKKTYFMIDNRIYALGSNIKCQDKESSVQTTLYQKHLSLKDTPTFVDTKEIRTFPVTAKALNIKKSHYLLDSVGNGYFVPENQKVFYARKTQKSRNNFDKKDTQGDFATAWINHGVKPTNGSYEYVVLPYCGEKELLKFSSKDYKVLQKDGDAHIIYDNKSDIYGAVFFKKQQVKNLPFVSKVERSCMIMYKKINNTLQVAVGDPDVHREKKKFNKYGYRWAGSILKKNKITFNGNWKLLQTVDGVKIISANKDRTLIEFAGIDGKTFNFYLK